MSLKKTLYVCIGSLLVLLALQGASSLYQVNRLSNAAFEVAAANRMSGDARQLWSRFQDTERALQHMIQFVDAASADQLRSSFNERANELKVGSAALRRTSIEALKQDAGNVSDKIEIWLSLASKHVATEGVTELPAYHLLSRASAEVEAAIRSMVEQTDHSASETASFAHALANGATYFTMGAILAGLCLGMLLGWQALNSLHRQLGADPGEVARVANAVADGNLTVEIDLQGVPPGSVMASMAKMQRSLEETVTRVLSISSTLASGSNEIAIGNSHLSHRTEEQAASLERTAATMEQLGVTVRHNAENALKGSELADLASAAAVRGGEVVGEAVVTMREINSSARKITDIISVIDGIAFQTNILALNAAVEAARAGELGRGLAVVASEVRGLAQRSALAAREIKSLITASVERIESGSVLVDQAGSTMHEVVEVIERAAAVMAEIRNASSEQSAGVAQVGQSVLELDRATQQNVSLAEQTACAAESLKTQGQRLAQAMAFFKLAAVNGPSGQSQRARQAGLASETLSV